MFEGRVLYLSDLDFKPEAMLDESISVQARLKPKAFDASLTADVVIWRDMVVLNRLGSVGVISETLQAA